MTKIKMLIDTDPGVDDAMAIFYAGLCPEIEIVGMSCVFGNVTAKIATRNALVLAEMMEQDIPVAMGDGVPMVQVPNPVSDYVHGVEGFGDIPPQMPKAQADPRPAAQFIVDMINDNPGEIVLCPVGPLTNIARALELDPSIATKVKDIVIMGGAVKGGNVSEFAEANVWNDPHAADIVFAADWSVMMVGLDVTQQVACVRDDFAEITKESPILGGFLEQAADFYINFYENEVGISGCYLHDPAAIIACHRPELFSVEKQAVEVIVEGPEIGRTKPIDSPTRRSARLCTGIDGPAVKKLWMDVLKTGR